VVPPFLALRRLGFWPPPGAKNERFFFDTNVLLDIATADPVWLPWSEHQFRTITLQGPVFINPIIYAELARLLQVLPTPTVFRRLPRPYSAGWLAAQVFVKYRRGGGARTSPLPDFYIGAQAEVENRTLITRDATRYRAYFPNLTIITP
jgi:predicted nucleic acid-binding protein